MLSAKMIVFVFVALHIVGAGAGVMLSTRMIVFVFVALHIMGEGRGGGYVEREDDRVCIRSSSYYYFHTR